MLAGKPKISLLSCGLLVAAAVLATIWVLSPPATRHLLRNSAVLAGGATSIALPLGMLLAVLLARFNLPGRRIAAAALGLLLFLPLFVQISGWDAAVGKLGWHTLAFGSGAAPWLAGMRATIFLHGVAAVPWVTLLVGLGLSQVDARQEEAALLDASPPAVLLRITLPQCWSFVVAAGLWVAVSTANDMTVTNIYLNDPHDMTLTEQFYMNYSTASDAQRAVLAVLPGLGGLVVLIVAAMSLLSQFSSRRVLAGSRQRVVLAAGQARWPLAALLWIIVLTLTLVPIASLITKAGFVVVQHGSQREHSWSAAQCLEMVAQAPRRFASEFQMTFVAAAMAATVALALSLALSWPARRGGWCTVPLLAAAVLALAIPGPLVGVGLIHAFNQAWSPVLIWLYDRTLVAPAIAQAIRALPLAALLVWHSLATLADDELAAAALDGAGPARTLWLVALPQRWPALCGTWIAALAIAAGDLAWSILVIPPGGETIQRRVFGLVHYGVEEQVAGISLVVVIGYAVLAGLVLTINRPRVPS